MVIFKKRAVKFPNIEKMVREAKAKYREGQKFSSWKCKQSKTVFCNLIFLLLTVWTHNDVPGFLKYFSASCQRLYRGNCLPGFFFLRSPHVNTLDFLSLRNDLPPKLSQDVKTEHEMAILATARFSLLELRKARISIGWKKYHLFRQLSKSHQRTIKRVKERRKTACSPEVIRSVEEFVFARSNPSTVFLTVPSLFQTELFLFRFVLESKRFAFLDGKFPLLDRDTIDVETMEKEEDEEDEEEKKHAEFVAVFLSLKSMDVEEGDHSFLNDFSHCSFKDISTDNSADNQVEMEEGSEVVFSFVLFEFLCTAACQICCRKGRFE
jgi:hypothetical protein